jgi:hypothetical protein
VNAALRIILLVAELALRIVLLPVELLLHARHSISHAALNVLHGGSHWQAGRHGTRK